MARCLCNPTHGTGGRRMTITLILALSTALSVLVLRRCWWSLRRPHVVGSARRRKPAVSALPVIVVVLLAAPSAQAADFPVTNHNDSGAGSLRQAITDA